MTVMSGYFANRLSFETIEAFLIAPQASFVTLERSIQELMNEQSTRWNELCT